MNGSPPGPSRRLRWAFGIALGVYLVCAGAVLTDMTGTNLVAMSVIVAGSIVLTGALSAYGWP